MSDREREIRERLAAATPGEWTARGQTVRHVASVAWCGESGSIGVSGESEFIDAAQAARNAALIAHAPGDLRYLLSALDAARADRDAAVAAERERCARVCDSAALAAEYDDSPGVFGAVARDLVAPPLRGCAAAIRRGGER